jgi:glycosyltransferase involved in cell wall biosynthesis
MDAVDVSAALIIRDAAPHLPKVIAHLEQQSYPAGRFEIVAVDCGSTDGSAGILERHAEGSPVKIRSFAAGPISVASARNRAIAESNGQYVLFLDAELLASPRLIESHVRAQQQHGGKSAIVGNIGRHPQAEMRARLAHFLPWDVEPFVNNQPLRFVDWRCWNLSLPRAVLQEARGFDESLALPGLEDVELAWRLEQLGLPGYFNEQAVAYAWRPMDAEVEWARRYAEGFTLWEVLGKTRSDMLANRFLGPGARPWTTSELMLVPLYQRLCRNVSTQAPSLDWLCKRMSRAATIQGYRDASRGKAPRVVKERT